MQPNLILKHGSALSVDKLQNFVEKACKAAGLRGAVTIMITNSREMRSLNAKFRGQSHATDVLTFSAPASLTGFAGDIAISFDIAARNANHLGHSIQEEIQILALHGILHLAGYDHDNDQGEMARRERRLRTRLALPTGLIERSSGRKKPRQAAHA